MGLENDADLKRLREELQKERERVEGGREGPQWQSMLHRISGRFG